MLSDKAKAQHVLVIEDDPDFASLLRSLLSQEGYTVAVAHNGEDAIAELDNTTPDLITLDVNMPEKSGVFVYRDIRANQRLRDIPVIVVTGLTREDEDMESIIRSLMELGNAPHPTYVEKPVDGPHFLRTVQEAISSNQSKNC